MLLWADGFDHYGATGNFIAAAQYVYTTNSGNEPLRIGTNPAFIRTGNHYWDATGMVYNNWYAGRLVGGAATILGAGAAFYFPGPPGADNFCPFMFVSGNKDTFQCSLRLHPDGSLSVHNGKDGTQYGVSNPGVVVWGAYAYIEFKAVCDAVNGSMAVRVNNNTVLVVNGVNTNPVGSGTLTGVMTGTRNASTGGGAICYAISDYVIWSGDGGGRNSDFLGDLRCRTIYPTTDGPLQDWTANGAASGFDCLDNIPPDGAKYIAGTNVGDKSSFGLGDIPGNTSDIFGVFMAARISKSDAGTCEVTPQINSNGTVADGTPVAPGTAYAYYNSLWETNPDTGGNWDKNAINALVAQVERTA